jgi:threonine dehydrogenase-like Zn-dependent dehydrogenase
LQAVIFNKHLEYRDNHPEPEPADGECIIKIHLAGVCATDLQIIKGYMGFSGILGHEFVGTVTEGSETWIGKRVAGEINCVCTKCKMCQAGLANHCRNRTVLGIAGRNGCFAEFTSLPERNLHEIPDTLSDDQAVFVEPLAAAYQVLAQCRIEPRMNVAVVGPGRLGLLVAQVLASTGCRLTVIGRNREKLLRCEKKGIQGIHVDELAHFHDRDVVVDCTGTPSGFELAMNLARPRGTIILKSTYADDSNGQAQHPGGSINPAPLVINEITVIGSRCGPFPEAINALAREAVEVQSMISKTFPLKRAAEALAAAASPDVLKILFKP